MSFSTQSYNLTQWSEVLCIFAHANLLSSRADDEIELLLRHLFLQPLKKESISALNLNSVNAAPYGAGGNSLFFAVVQSVGGGQAPVRAWFPPAGEGLFFWRTTSGQHRLPWRAVA